MSAPGSTASGGMLWPIRVRVVGDLSGGRGSGSVRPVSGTLDDLMAALEPRLDATAESAHPVRFRTLSDFTPGELGAGLTPRAGAAEKAGALDSILHSPAFQSLESAWRGLERLLQSVPGGGAASVEVVDIPRAALRQSPAAIFESADPDPRRRPTAILIDDEAGASGADAAWLEKLAALAERRRVPIVLSGAPSLLGLRHSAHLPALTDPAARLDAAWGGAWRSLRQSDAARWVSLTVNRILLRAPYTRERGGHDESVSAARPETYLWGRGVWLAGIDLVRSVAAHGHPLALAGIFPERYHHGLPVWSWNAPGGAPLSSSVEASLDADTVQRLVRAGLTPISEPAGPGSALLPLIVNAYRPDPRRIPVEGTLGHTLVLARFVAALVVAAPDAEARSDDGAAGDLLRSALRQAMATCLVDLEAAALDAAVERPQGRRMARAALRGDLSGSGRAEEIELSIPLADSSTGGTGPAQR